MIRFPTSVSKIVSTMTFRINKTKMYAPFFYTSGKGDHNAILAL